METPTKNTEAWLDALGYTDSVGVVHRMLDDVRADHPYAREIELMLSPHGEIRSSAVYEVDRVPAVCFIELNSPQALDPNFIDEVRRKIWNQNLVSILVVVQADQATAYPVPRTLRAAAPMELATASSNGPFSANEIFTGNVHTRLPDWFDRKKRVDRVLLDNISASVKLLTAEGLSIMQAQLLLGKCIFVSYLEHRGIVSDDYRRLHSVGTLLPLLLECDANGLDRLFRQLKSDFNGDLLEIEGGANVDWRAQGNATFDLLAQFLLQTRLRDGQKSLWAYDFKYIPVELISGIYESFLSNDQIKEGAFYTPRHLAYLAVDEAFRGINEPWKEVVLDGACGSGILITSAYRRMLGAMRASQAIDLTYSDRRDVLMNGIRGGDISTSACKVTAFSLYLVLLEDLAPSDIARLQEDQNVKLPPLIGKVLSGDGVGDFFDAKNIVAKSGQATIVISNPPWFEPKDGDSSRLYESWWSGRYKDTLPRRQIALAFVRRATDAVRPGGRVCLILPAAILGAADTGSYLGNWFREFKPERIFNLADMRRVLFDGAIHPTAVVTGARREGESVGKIPVRESFEYFAPKSDVSLAFGRLSVHGFDRKNLYTHAVCDDAELLRTYFWGNELDESLISRLRLNGRFVDHAHGANARFQICKGFHLTDNSKASRDATPLRKYPFLSTAIGKSRHPKDRLFVLDSDLQEFPSEIQNVADYGSREGAAFEGARVIFPDGADNKTLEVRACYTNQPFCFTQTVGAIVDRQGDEALMMFVAAYLRSKLARYLLFYTTFSLAMERPHVKLAEISQLPFVLPAAHSDPKRALDIVKKVGQLLARHESDVLSDANYSWAIAKSKIDELICDYFDLTLTERKVVEDTCEYFIPNRQPTGLGALNRQLLCAPTVDDFNEYSKLLQHELETWMARFEGSGQFNVAIRSESPAHLASHGIVRIGIEVATNEPAKRKEIDDAIVNILVGLRGQQQFPQVGNDTLSLSSDILIAFEDSYYLLKPLVKRLWLAGAAAQDAYRIVQTVRESL